MRDIIGFEGLYKATEEGTIGSLNHYGHKGKFGILKGQKDKYGYFHVHLYKNGKSKRVLVSRIIAQAYPEICGEWFEGCQVDHINGIRDDNRPENLRICTCKENQNFELCKINKSIVHKDIHKNCLSTSKPVLQLDKNGYFIAEYPSVMEAKRATGINHGHIAECCRGNGIRKTAGGFKWEYKMTA